MPFFFKLLNALCLSELEGDAPPLKVLAQVSGKSGKSMGPYQGYAFSIGISEFLPVKSYRCVCLYVCLGP